MNNSYRKQYQYPMCWETAIWSALTDRELQLEMSWWLYLERDHQQSQQAYVEKGQSTHLEMKRQVNWENDNVDTQASDSEHTWRRSGKHTRRKSGEHAQQLEMICAPSTVDVKCTYKCTNFEDDQRDCHSTGELMGRSSVIDLCRTSAMMSTEAVPNENKHDLGTNQIVNWMASRETVTEPHRATQSRSLPKGGYQSAFVWGLETYDFREFSTEGTDWDIFQTACQSQCRKTMLEAYKPAWPRLREYE